MLRVIHVAQSLKTNPRLFDLAMAYGCSLAFMTPLGHPVNTIFWSWDRGYKFSDFLREGYWLTLILIVTILVLIAVG